MSASQESPLVSVVIPTHNRSTAVLEALKSVWEQSYRPLEVVVVDDGSSDDTKAEVADWELSHTEDDAFVLRYVYQANAGANSARNLGIADSHGPLIAFLDSDDRWLPDKLAKQVPIFDSSPDVGDVYCGLRHISNESGANLGVADIQYRHGRILAEMLVHDVTGPTSCHVVRRSCFDDVGMFDVSLPARQDWDMWVRVSERYEIVGVPEVFVEQFEHDGPRVRSNPMNEVIAHRRIFDKTAPLRAMMPFSIRCAARAAMYRRRGRVYAHRGVSRLRAFGWITAAIATWPFAFDSYAALLGLVLPKPLRECLHRAWNRVFVKTPLAIRSH